MGFSSCPTPKVHEKGSRDAFSCLRDLQLVAPMVVAVEPSESGIHKFKSSSKSGKVLFAIGVNGH